MESMHKPVEKGGSVRQVLEHREEAKPVMKHGADKKRHAQADHKQQHPVWRPGGYALVGEMYKDNGRKVRWSVLASYDLTIFASRLLGALTSESPGTTGGGRKRTSCLLLELELKPPPRRSITGAQ